MNKNGRVFLPLDIQELLTGIADGADAAAVDCGLVNISAKGFPNCSKSSEALLDCSGMSVDPPNKSTIG